MLCLFPFPFETTFSDKIKASFNIDHIHNVSSTMDYESFKRLVLPQGHKSMLESLARSHFRKREGKIHSRKLSNTLRGEGRHGCMVKLVR